MSSTEDHRADQRDQRADRRDQAADERDQRAELRALSGDAQAAFLDQREQQADRRDAMAHQRDRQRLLAVECSACGAQDSETLQALETGNDCPVCGLSAEAFAAIAKLRFS
ncbi:MAG TPA: hypothetical protein VHE56_02135 [Mycobacteriales bacterium]|nr:hypothetical protein [Mycobacteriales bacterium]